MSNEKPIILCRNRRDLNSLEVGDKVLVALGLQGTGPVEIMVYEGRGRLMSGEYKFRPRKNIVYNNLGKILFDTGAICFDGYWEAFTKDFPNDDKGYRLETACRRKE